MTTPERKKSPSSKPVSSEEIKSFHQQSILHTIETQLAVINERTLNLQQIIHERTTNLQDDIRSLNERIDKIETSVDAKIDRLDAKIDKLDSKY